MRETTREWQVTWTELKDGRPYRRWRAFFNFDAAKSHLLRRLAELKPVDGIEHRVDGKWRPVDLESGQLVAEPADIGSVHVESPDRYERVREHVLFDARHVCQDCGGIASTVRRLPGRLVDADWLDPDALFATCELCHAAKSIEHAELQRRRNLDDTGTPDRDPTPTEGTTVTRRRRDRSHRRILDARDDHRSKYGAVAQTDRLTDNQSAA